MCTVTVRNAESIKILISLLYHHHHRHRHRIGAYHLLIGRCTSAPVSSITLTLTNINLTNIFLIVKNEDHILMAVDPI